MKSVIKKLMLIIAVAIVSVCSFYYSREAGVSAEGFEHGGYTIERGVESVGDSGFIMVLDEEANTYYKSNTQAGQITGYTGEAFGKKVTITASPNTNFKIWGWIINDGTNEYIVTAYRQVTIDFGAGNNLDVDLQVNADKTTLTISKLWANLKVEPIFDHYRHSVKMEGLKEITAFANDDTSTEYTKYHFYYTQKTADVGGYDEYKEVFYSVDSAYYYLDKVYVKNNKCYIKEAATGTTIGDTPVTITERYVPINAAAYIQGTTLEIHNCDVIQTPRIEITSILVNGSTPADSVATIISTLLYNEDGHKISQTQDYSINLTMDKDYIVSVEHKKMYDVTLEILQDGGAVTDTKITTSSKKFVEPANWYWISGNRYIVYENASYDVVAQNITEDIAKKTYIYYDVEINGTKTNLISVSAANGDANYSINYISHMYNVTYVPVKFTSMSGNFGQFSELPGMKVPTEDSVTKISRGQILTINASTMAGINNVGYDFVGWIQDANNLDPNNVTKSESLELQLNAELPKDLVVYVCFSPTKYKISIEVDNKTLNNGTSDINALSNAQLGKANNFVNLSAGLFDTDLIIGDKVDIYLVVNEGFTITGAKVVNPTGTDRILTYSNVTINNDAKLLIDPLQVDYDLLACADPTTHEIKIHVNSEYVVYSLELVVSNGDMSGLVADTSHTHTNTEANRGVELEAASYVVSGDTITYRPVGATGDYLYTKDGDTTSYRSTDDDEGYLVYDGVKCTYWTTYISKIVYTGLHLYDTVQLMSKCANDALYRHVGYYYNTTKILVGEDSATHAGSFVLGLDKLSYFTENTATIIARYQSRESSLIIEANKRIIVGGQEVTVSYVPVVEQSGAEVTPENEEYVIQTGVPFTVTLNNITFGYYVAGATIDPAASATIDSIVGNVLTLTVVTEDPKVLTLDFAPIEYNVVVVNRGVDDDNEYKKDKNDQSIIVTVENLSFTITRFSKYYYLVQAYPLTQVGGIISDGTLTCSENEKAYLDNQTNNLVVSFTLDELKRIITSNWLVDEKDEDHNPIRAIKLALEYNIAKYAVNVTINGNGDAPTLVVKYTLDPSLDATGTEIVAERSGFEGNVVTYRIPMDSGVTISVTDFKIGTVFEYWEGMDNTRYPVVDGVIPDFTITDLSTTQNVTLKYKLIDYTLHIVQGTTKAGMETHILADGGASMVVAKVGEYEVVNSFIHVGDKFSIDAKYDNSRKLGYKVSSIYYFSKYETGDYDKLYTRVAGANGYIYTPFEGEPADGEYYVKHVYTPNVEIKNAIVNVGVFNPTDYAMGGTDNYEAWFYVDYEKIQIKLNPSSSATILAALGIDGEVADYTSTADLNTLDVDSGKITITSTFKSLMIKLGSTEEEISVNFKKGLKLPNSFDVANQTPTVGKDKDGNYTIEINVTDLFSSGYIKPDTESIDVVFPYEIEQKKVQLTTQIVGASFYENIQLAVNIGGVEDTVSYQTEYPHRFLTNFKIKYAWKNGFDTAFKINRITIYVDGTLYEDASAAKADGGISSLSIDAQREVDVLLISNIKIVLQVEAIIRLNGSELVGDTYVEETFGYDLDTHKPVEYDREYFLNHNKITIGPNGTELQRKLESAVSIELVNEKGFPAHATYVGDYGISISFNKTVEGYTWLSQIKVPYKISLRIVPLNVYVKLDTTGIEALTQDYDGDVGLTEANRRAIIGNFYFSKDGSTKWLGDGADSNIILASGKLVMTRIDKNDVTNPQLGKTVGAKEIMITGFELYSQNKELKDSIKLVDEPIIIEGLLTVNQKTITIYGYDVYDKIYDGTNSATPVGLDDVTIVGYVEGDDVELDKTKLIPEFNNSAVSTKVGDKTVYVKLSDYGLTGADSANYNFAQYTIKNKTIYPNAVTYEFEDGRKIQIENKSTDPKKANTIPVGSKLTVVEIENGDENYYKYYNAIDSKTSSRAVFNKGYIIRLNGKPVSNGLYISLPNPQGDGSIYYISGDEATEVVGLVEGDSFVINQKDLPSGVEVFFTLQNRNYMPVWAIILIVVGSLALIGGTVAVVLIVRKKRVSSYAKNEKI